MKSFERIKDTIFISEFEHTDGEPYFPFTVSTVERFQDVEDIICKQSPEDKEAEAFRDLSVKLTLNHKLGEIMYSAAVALARCESPIEKQFLLALQHQAYQDDNFSFVQQECELSWGLDCYSRIYLWPQFEVGKYRADFRVVYKEDDGLDPADPRQRKKLVAEVLIELDGHEFHERTKQQASRDKARDRHLAAAGYTVLRFTGSDIWKDPISCAKEVIEFLHKRAFKGTRRERKT